MSQQLLTNLRQMHAFDSAPPVDKLARTHVPFDVLTTTTNYETALHGAAKRGERVALVGASGSGKSSISAHVFGVAGSPGLAPIQVRVDIENPLVATDPAHFATHLVRTIAGAVQAHMGSEAAAAAANLEQQAVKGAPAATPTHAQLNVGLPWLSAQLAKDLGGAVQLDPTGAYKLEQAELALQIIVTAGLQPVLILDDTDHWLAHGTTPPPDERISAFFGPVVRLISEDFGAASAIVAVHTSYLDHPGYDAARDFLETTIALPRLPNHAAVAMVLARRAADATQTDQTVEAFLDDDALHRLWADYSDDDSMDIRGLLRTVHVALGHACDSGGERISRADIEQGID